MRHSLQASADVLGYVEATLFLIIDRLVSRWTLIVTSDVLDQVRSVVFKTYCYCRTGRISGIEKHSVFSFWHL